MKPYIKEEFDSAREAVVNPWDLIEKNPDCPKTVVTCFAKNLIEYAVLEYNASIIGHISTANGKIPLYKIIHGTREIGLIMTLVGAPAAVSEYEELFAMGVEKILVFGTCGVLDRNIEGCSIILPDRAIRDEGTSYHYAEDDHEIVVNASTLDMMMQYFEEAGISYTVGKVWTSDGIYRETKAKVTRRKAMGCICVDMECSAIAALAGFRDKTIAQFFYSADNLDVEVWEERCLTNDSRIDSKKKITDLAIGLGLKL